jgi:predicted Zn-dependent protease
MSRDHEPRSLFDTGRSVRIEGPARYMSLGDCTSLFERIQRLSTGGGDTSVRIDSRWYGNFRWARNAPTTAGDTANHTVNITRNIRGAIGNVSTNKFDDASLSLALRTAERVIQFYSENKDAAPLPGKQEYLKPQLWSDATYSLGAAPRSSAARALAEPALQAKLLSAGYVEVSAHAAAVLSTTGMDAYYAETEAEFSATVRNPGGTGSGWAGVSNKDWSAIDAGALASIAQKKCVDSADPRAVEPGRYTLIMEPQAVHQMMVQAIYQLDRYSAENFNTVFTLRPGQSKIGLKVFDERITLSTDPMDPEMGYIPFDYQGSPYRPVKWVEHGILKELAYSRQYALSQLGHGTALPNPYSYRMSGGTTSIDEMIATTKRGLLVTRLNGVSVLHGPSLLSTGTSRDGLWLIENGKIKFPVKNMRFTESPMFIFNNIAQIGKPVRVYAGNPATVPPVKVLDFNFSSLADAV